MVILSDAVGALRAHPAFRDLAVTGDPATEVGPAVADSRLVGPGAVFCCVPGARHDGHDHAPAAVAAGAAALLVERPLGLGVPELVVGSVRTAMGPLAATLVDRPSDQVPVIGVTGTNGKTTTIHLVGAVLESAGRSCGLIGTLTGVRTTPEAPELQRRLAELRDQPVDVVAMEVSSHALDQHRVDGTRYRVAIFTNLSRDHLDHHGTMEAYFAAKARLFEPERCQAAVCNLDDPHGRLLSDAALVPTTGYSLTDAEDLELDSGGSRFTWRGWPVRLALAGRFNVANALGAATALAELGLAPEEIAVGLSAAGPVPGRFEQVDEGQRFLAAVDYAHTPDGLAQVLEASRELAGSGRVILVFGAGGDRDRSKRPAMGEVAARLADVAILTTDNPRHEDPGAIMDQVSSGTGSPEDLHVEADRAAAIGLAVAAAGPGDVLIVAGKGHESTQVVGDTELAFDDRVVLRDALRASLAGEQRP